MKRIIYLIVLFFAMSFSFSIAQTSNCGRGFTTTADFQSGFLLGLNTNVADQLQLDNPGRPLPYVNVACSGRGTVCRIDANTGEIIGEYRTAPSGMGANPSRTTVDKYGNVWVTNRDEGGMSGGFPKGSVTRIGVVCGGTRCDATGTPDPNGQYLKPPFCYSTCVDRDGDGLIKTSRGLGNVLGWSNAGGVNTDGGVSTAEDETIITYTRVRAVGARTVAIDNLNNLWVGGSTNRYHEKLDGFTGQPIPGTLFNNGTGGYGGFIDNNGDLWSSGSPSNVGTLVYNVQNGTATTINGQGNYGLGVDPVTGDVWHTTVDQGIVYKISPNGTSLGAFNYGSGTSQGCAVDAAGNVWVAHSIIGSKTTVGHLKTDGTFIGNVSLPGGAGPTGVAIDANGKIWVTCYDSDNAMRIDPNAGPIVNGSHVGAVDLVVALGAGATPYNYSDMTGYIVCNVTVPSGTWNATYDSQKAGNKWGRITWNDSIPTGAGIRVEARASDNQLTLASKPFVEITKGESFCCSGVTGRYIEIRVTLFRQQTVFDSPILYDLTVECCDVYPNTPPTITSSRGCNSDTIKVAAGQPLNFTVTGNDIDAGQIVTLTSTELPTGATMTPVLPATGNPVQSTFSWTTTFAQVGVYNFGFEVNDTYCYSATCPTIVNVVPCPTIKCSGVGISCVGLCNGRATVDISGNPANFTYTWNTTPAQTTKSIANLCPGTYKVITYDGYACLDSCTVIVPSSPCDGYQTFTQGGWGATPKGKNVASYLKTNFAAAFPTGLEIGCTNKLKLTSWQAVVDFLPSGSTARALPAGTLTNPGASYTNVLAGQLVAATINVRMDSVFASFAPSSGNLGNLVIASGPFSGWTVNMLIAEANKAIGGCGSTYSFSAINNALNLFNNNYDGGYYFGVAPNRCFLSCPIDGTSGSLRIAENGHLIDDVNDLMVYPNPAHDKITIKFSSLDEGMVSIDIIGLNGEVVRNAINQPVGNGENFENTIDVSDLTPGVYVIRFQDGSQSLMRKITIVK